MGNLKYTRISLVLYMIMESIGQPVPQSREPFVSEVDRVKRQAGYVYNKPSVSFDLPTSVPIVSTQAPTVDRTQAQMMYYAYPAPAAGGNAVNIGGSSNNNAPGGGSSTATASSGGYNYGAQNTAPARAQSTSATASSRAGVGVAQSSSTGSSGYGYNAPSTGTESLSNIYQATSVGSTQTVSEGSSKTASSSGSAPGSGYAYIAPTNTQLGSKMSPMIDVSTNAPKYLPPTSGVVSGDSAPVTQPLEQYLPPNEQSDSTSSFVSSGISVNTAIQSDTGSDQSASYIPPAPTPIGSCFQPPCPSSGPVINSTPRPFSPAPPATGYLPPNVNSQAPSQNAPSTPASAYLPPVL